MSLPSNLSESLDKLISTDISFKDIDSDAKSISQKYRANNNSGNRLVTTNNEAISYALSRMPATYESVRDCLKNIFENNEFEINSVLDVGAGTGAATWATYYFIENDNHTCTYTCCEREDEMIYVGKKLMDSSELSDVVSWKNFDILQDSIENKYDFVISSYMVNELPKDEFKKVIDKLWNSTNNVLLIVEPGTPKGFSNIKNIREILLSKGANIIAPCTHQRECPLSGDDWCQFTCRVQRSKIHKRLKDGNAPFEDEKYSYIAVSKNECNRAQNRILRHPIINKGYSEFKVCNENSEVKNIKLSKKDGNIYKESKKKSSGDSLNIL